MNKFRLGFLKCGGKSGGGNDHCKLGKCVKKSNSRGDLPGHCPVPDGVPAYANCLVKKYQWAVYSWYHARSAIDHKKPQHKGGIALCYILKRLCLPQLYNLLKTTFCLLWKCTGKKCNNFMGCTGDTVFDNAPVKDGDDLSVSMNLELEPGSLIQQQFQSSQIIYKEKAQRAMIPLLSLFKESPASARDSLP